MFVSDVLTSAGALLNDPSNLTWTHSVLLPYFQKAFKELVQTLENNSAPILKEVSSLTTVTAGSKTITTITNIRTPITLWERASGSSDSFVPMEEKDWEPEEEQSDTLRYWIWREGEIKLLGSTADRQIKLKYIKTLDTPASTSSTVTLPEGELFLASRTAALAAALGGGNMERAAALQADAEEAKLNLIVNQVHSMQGVPIRRKGYRV